MSECLRPEQQLTQGWGNVREKKTLRNWVSKAISEGTDVYQEEEEAVVWDVRSPRTLVIKEWFL